MSKSTSCLFAAILAKRACRLAYVLMAVLLVPDTALADPRAVSDQGEAIPAGQAEDASSEWLDELLARELDYDEDQVAEFKKNVADMPREKMKAIVRQIKWRQAGDESWRAESVVANRMSRAYQGREAARAYAHPTPAAWHGGGGPVLPRSYPQRIGNFRGYSVWSIIR